MKGLGKGAENGLQGHNNRIHEVEKRTSLAAAQTQTCVKNYLIKTYGVTALTWVDCPKGSGLRKSERRLVVGAWFTRLKTPLCIKCPKFGQFMLACPCSFTVQSLDTLFFIKHIV